jgi:hypothetical protein
VIVAPALLGDGVLYGSEAGAERVGGYLHARRHVDPSSTDQTGLSETTVNACRRSHASDENMRTCGRLSDDCGHSGFDRRGSAMRWLVEAFRAWGGSHGDDYWGGRL